jgi:hypothetical protein
MTVTVSSHEVRVVGLSSCTGPEHLRQNDPATFTGSPPSSDVLAWEFASGSRPDKWCARPCEVRPSASTSWC